MPYTMKLPYVRFVRQVSSENKSITGWKNSMNTTFEALKVAPWEQSNVKNQWVGLPLNTPLTFEPSHANDCYKMSSTVSDSGRQVCHMGMVAYRFKIPTDAITGDKRITSITLPLGADKFCVKGLKAVAYLSSTATPPTDWTICRTGDVATADITTGSVTHGVLPSLEATLSLSQNKNGDFTLNISHTIDYSYLYIILTNWDYEDFRTTREYYIEGSGMLEGETAQFTFNAASVTADPIPSPLVGLGWTYGWGGCGCGFTIAGTANYYKNLAQFPSYTFTFTLFGTAGLVPHVSAQYSGGFASIFGSIMVAEIQSPTVYPYTGIYFKSLSADLTSLPLDVYVNVWTSSPLVHLTNRNYVATGAPQSSTVTASQLHSLFFKEGTLSIPFSDSSGANAQTQSLTNVGHLILKKGSSYGETTKFPVNIPVNKNSPTVLYVTIAPYNVTQMSSTGTVSWPSDLTGEIYIE